jgi:hypothetical protein
MAFKPKRIEEPEEGPPAPRPSSAELAACIGPLASNLISTSPSVPSVAPMATLPASSVRVPVEPLLMMSFKASKPFAKMLAEAAEKEGGLRRLVARVFSEAGYPVPLSELQPQRRRRTYD